MTAEEFRRARIAYSMQRSNARTRKIEWEFTFFGWLETWLNSGKLAQRGRLPDQYCMARFEDRGPYSRDNVKIITTRENLAEVEYLHTFYGKRGRSNKTLQAIALIGKGYTRYKAAKEMGIAMSTIYRAAKDEATQQTA